MTLSARWLPLPEGRAWPYLGGAAGYFIPVTKGFGGKAEDAKPGAGLIAGFGYSLSEMITLMSEIRGMVHQQAKGPAGLMVQSGGASVLLGLTISLEPELRPGEPPSRD